MWAVEVVLHLPQSEAHFPFLRGLKPEQPKEFLIVRAMAAFDNPILPGAVWFGFTMQEPVLPKMLFKGG